MKHSPQHNIPGSVDVSANLDFATWFIFVQESTRTASLCCVSFFDLRVVVISYTKYDTCMLPAVLCAWKINWSLTKHACHLDIEQLHLSMQLCTFCQRGWGRSQPHFPPAPPLQRRGRLGTETPVAASLVGRSPAAALEDNRDGYKQPTRFMKRILKTLKPNRFQ